VSSNSIPPYLRTTESTPLRQQTVSSTTENLAEAPTRSPAPVVGTHFPSCYKCSWENGPDNWIPLSGPFFFPAAFVARWKMRSHKNHWSLVRERIGPAGPATCCITRMATPEPARSEHLSQNPKAGAGFKPEPESPIAKPQSPERAQAQKRGTMSPRPPKWFLWDRIFHRATNAAGKTGRITGSTHFPSCYKCSWENGQDNWIQLSCPFSQLHLWHKIQLSGPFSQLHL
jgi:hypothetical protein